MLLGRFRIYNWDPSVPPAFRRLSSLLSQHHDLGNNQAQILQEIQALGDPFSDSCSAFQETLVKLGDLSLKTVMKFHRSQSVSAFASLMLFPF